MDDLISRKAAIDALADMHCKSDEDGYVWIIRSDAWARIDALPFTQPEIIRCRDCRYYQDNNGGYPHMNCKWDANETPDADDFCSGAERREDD